MDVSTNRVTEHLCSRSENGQAEPIVRGTSVHLIGSTLLIVQLEPSAAMRTEPQLSRSRLGSSPASERRSRLRATGRTHCSPRLSGSAWRSAPATAPGRSRVEASLPIGVLPSRRPDEHRPCRVPSFRARLARPCAPPPAAWNGPATCAARRRPQAAEQDHGHRARQDLLRQALRARPCRLRDDRRRRGAPPDHRHLAQPAAP